MIITHNQGAGIYFADSIYISFSKGDYSVLNRILQSNSELFRIIYNYYDDHIDPRAAILYLLHT